MDMPALHGTCAVDKPFVYTACDRGYFTDFAPSLINSVLSNTHLDVHVHVFNPTDQTVDPSLFDRAAERWNNVPTDPVEKSFYDRTLNAMGKGKDSTIHERMQKTYFACARFIRLAELFSSSVSVFAMDVDAVVRSGLPHLPCERDFYIHYIAGKRARYLAGGIYLHPCLGSTQFLQTYATKLRESFHRDYVYWGLDQDLLDQVVPAFCHGQLPIGMIDWNMDAHSPVWTAKGTRKEHAMFVSEKLKYIS